MVVSGKSRLREQFEEQGFLKVEGLLDPTNVLDPVIEEYKGVLDRYCERLYEDGELSSKYEGLSFEDKFLKVWQELGYQPKGFDFSLPFKGVTEDTPFWTGPAVFNALTNTALLDVVEELIGPEIYSNPVQHVRIKPPEKYLPKNEEGLPQLGATQWHQDHGVVTEEADKTNMVTAWFSLTDAPVECGPLEVVPYSHREGLLTHCLNYDNGPGNHRMVKGTRQIPQKLFEYRNKIPLPTKRGDVVFLHKETVHGSLSNISERTRWSFDLRYNPIGQSTGREEFPGFVARSASNPVSELHDAKAWEQMWIDCRTRMSKINQGANEDVKFGRWAEGHPDCEV